MLQTTQTSSQATQPSTSRRPHVLHMEDRTQLFVTGITDVDSYSDTIVLCKTVCGDMIIEGENLHVLELKLENGELQLQGTITAITYTKEENERKTGGFFQRLFR